MRGRKKRAGYEQADQEEGDEHRVESNVCGPTLPNGTARAAGSPGTQGMGPEIDWDAPRCPPGRHPGRRGVRGLPSVAPQLGQRAVRCLCGQGHHVLHLHSVMEALAGDAAPEKERIGGSGPSGSGSGTDRIRPASVWGHHPMPFPQTVSTTPRDRETSAAATGRGTRMPERSGFIPSTTPRENIDQTGTWGRETRY